MGFLNCCYPKKCKNKQDIAAAVAATEVFIENKRTYYYYYTCIPLHELVTRISMLFKCKRKKYDTYLYE